MKGSRTVTIHWARKRLAFIRSAIYGIYCSYSLDADTLEAMADELRELARFARDQKLPFSSSDTKAQIASTAYKRTRTLMSEEQLNAARAKDAKSKVTADLENQDRPATGDAPRNNYQTGSND